MEHQFEHIAVVFQNASAILQGGGMHPEGTRMRNLLTLQNYKTVASQSIERLASKRGTSD